MNPKKALTCLLAVLVVAALALPAVAQEATTGTLEGRVTDDRGASVPGATISVTGPQGLQAARTGSDGRFSLPFLKGGKYEVKVEATGFATIILKDVEVQINRRTNLPIQVSAGKVETVEVQGQAPLIDTKSTSIGQNIKIQDFVNTVPIGRTYSDTFAIAPGVTGGGGTGAGNYSISGASGLENQYIIDGVNITNTGYGGIGSYNIVYGSLGTGVTTDFLDEVQVKTGGFEAEYGGATGGVLNTTVRNGTNDFSGGVSFYFTPRNTYSDFKTVELSVGSVNSVDRQTFDLGLSVGGPIIKDKLFYFVAYNPVQKKDRFEIVGGDFDTRFSTYGSTTYTAFPSAGINKIERKRTSNNWAAKLTWYMTTNHRFELTGFGDPSKGKKGPQNADTPSSSLRYLDFENGGGQSKIEYGGNNYAVKYNGVFTPNFFGEVQVSRHDGKFREDSLVDEPRVRDRRQQLCFLAPLSQPAPCNGVVPSAPTTWFVGGVGFLSNADDQNTTYTAKLTNVFGPVEVKYGIEYADIEYTDNQAYSGGPIDFQFPIDDDQDGAVDRYLTVPSTSGGIVDLRVLENGPTIGNYRVTRARFYPTPPPTKNKDRNAFAQVTWSITPAWTLKGGLRVTQERVEGSGAFTLPFQRGPSSFFVEEPQAYNPIAYTFQTVYAPRLGMTWDIAGDGRSKLYANVGRYFERIPNDLAVRSFSNEVGLSRYRFRNGPFDDETFSTPLSNPRVLTNPNDTTLFQGLEPSQIQDGSKLPYKDEAVLGFAYQIRPNLSVEIRGIYRKQGRVLEDVQFTTNESIINYYYGANYGYPYDPFGGSLSSPTSTTFPAALFGAYVLANPGENTPSGAGFTKPKHKYKALEFIVNKRLSDHWLFYGNYRYSRLRGNYEGLFRNDNGQSDPNITSLFDFPNSPTMRGQYAPGPLNNDRPHVLNLFASYIWDNGFNLGAGFNWQSGIPRTPLLAHPNYQNAGEIPGVNPIYFWWQDTTGDGVADEGETGPATEFFSDPTAVSAFPILYDYTDCKRGCFGRTPDEATLDLHAGYTFKIKDTRLDLGVDVFNIFDSQEPTTFDDNVESTAGIPDPDFLQVLSYQTPRRWRFNARWTF